MWATTAVTSARDSHLDKDVLVSCEFPSTVCCRHNHKITEHLAPMALTNLTLLSGNFGLYDSKAILLFWELEKILQLRMALLANISKLHFERNLANPTVITRSLFLDIYTLHNISATLHSKWLEPRSATLFLPMFGSLWTLQVFFFSSQVNFSFQFILIGWLIIFQKAVKCN